MSADIRRIIDQQFCCLLEVLQAEKSQPRLLAKINEFKVWLTNIIEHNNLPAYVVGNVVGRIREIEKSIITNDPWKTKLNLKWGAVQLEKEPYLLTQGTFAKEVGSLDAYTKLVENVSSEAFQINSSKVVNLKFIKDCRIEVGNARFIVLSNISNSNIYVETDTLYINNVCSSFINGTTKSQVRIHNSFDLTLDIDTNSMVIEDSFDLKMKKTQGLAVEDFNHPSLNVGETSESFQWI